MQSYEETDFIEENKDIVDVFKEVDDILLDVRDEEDKVKDVDHNVVIATTTDVLNNSENGNVNKMYRRYQAKWIAYMKQVNLVDIKNENEVDKALLGFFIEQSTHSSPSTLYVIYSCVNSWFIMNHGYRINDCLRVNKYLKAATSRYVARKSKVLKVDEVDLLLRFCMKSSYHEDTLLGVCLSL